MKPTRKSPTGSTRCSSPRRARRGRLVLALAVTLALAVGSLVAPASASDPAEPPPPFSVLVPEDPSPLPSICTPLLMDTEQNGVINWFAKAEGESMTVMLSTVSVNPAEQADMQAELLGPGDTPIDRWRQPWPTGSAANTPIRVTRTFDTTPNAVYKIRLTRMDPSGSEPPAPFPTPTPALPIFPPPLTAEVPKGDSSGPPPPSPTPLPTTPVAHHYQLVVRGAWQLGQNSPTARQFENTQFDRWFLAAGANEQVKVRLFSNERDFVAPGTGVTAVLIDPAGVQRASATRNDGVPFNVELSASSPTAGLWILQAEVRDGHYRIEKVGGDLGIYTTWLSGRTQGSMRVTRDGRDDFTVPVTLNFTNESTHEAAAPFTLVGHAFRQFEYGRYSVSASVPSGFTVNPASSSFLAACGQNPNLVFDVSSSNRPPTVSLSFPSPIDEASPPIVVAAEASDPDGNLDPYSFSFEILEGSGTLTPGAAPNLRLYSNPDGPSSARIKVTVRDRMGATASDTESIFVRNVPPIANAGPDQSQYWGLPVTLEGSATDPSPVDMAAGLNLRWYFEEGLQIPGTRAVRAFDTPGTRTATFEARDKDGSFGRDTAAISVGARRSALAYDGPSVAPWGNITLPARFADLVDAATARLAGHSLTFSVAGQSHSRPTDLNGLAGPRIWIPNPGDYLVGVNFAGDALYLPSSTAAPLRVRQRASTLTYTGSTGATFGFATLSAQFGDAEFPDTAVLGGHLVTFSVDGRTFTATTNGNGVATVSGPVTVPPGSHQVRVTFAGDRLYLPSSGSGSLVVASSAGKVTAGTLQTMDKGRGGFNVQSDGVTVKGELEFQNAGLNFHAPTLVALGISPDKKSAWFAGVGKDGERFLAYVEDNGEPGSNDRFTLWIGGTKVTEGNLQGGNIQIH